MNPDLEQHVRAALNTAAPEPPRLLDGADLRAAADPPEQSPQNGRRIWATAASVGAVAAVTVLAVAVAHGHDSGRPASTRPTSGASLLDPVRCDPTDLRITVHDPVPGSGADAGKELGVITIDTLDQQASCTLDPLPQLALTDHGRIVASLSAKAYEPSTPVVLGPARIARFTIVLAQDQSHCDGATHAWQAGALFDGGFTGTDITLTGCSYRITAATVRVMG